MPLGVISVTLNPNLVAGGNSTTGTVTLNGPAPRGGKTVLVTSNTPLVRVPATVTIPEGQLSVDFVATTSPVSVLKSPRSRRESAR